MTHVVAEAWIMTLPTWEGASITWGIIALIIVVPTTIIVKYKNRQSAKRYQRISKIADGMARSGYRESEADRAERMMRDHQTWLKRQAAEERELERKRNKPLWFL
jgi:hypothetical protein